MENQIMLKTVAIVALSTIAIALALPGNSQAAVIVIFICMIISGIAGYSSAKLLR